jgi:tripartite-type tricarboxylate transporter receptor subunit TctC
MVVKRFIVLAVLMMTLAAFPAQAAKRVALVIGNNTYATLPNLNNAKKDAEGMAAKLRGLGFDVILKTNAGSRTIGRALADFESRLAKADVALVFYAGHGIQANGKNHLIPSDANIEVEEDLRFESVDAQEFLQTMNRAGTPLNIVIIDACRDNPLPRRSRSAARGLAIHAAPAGIKGTAIVYSAAPGQTAQDGPKGGHGVFTGALLKVLDEPGLKLEDVFKKTARLVAASTRGNQDPWINSSVKGDFYFKPGLHSAPSTESTPINNRAIELTFWGSIKDSKDAADYQDYLAQFPRGSFARLAKRRIKKMKASQVASLPPPTHTGARPTPEAAGYPSKMINFVVPFGAGGSTDRFARIMSSVGFDFFAKGIKVQNHPGQGGTIGWKHLLSKGADGHTVILASPTPILAALAEKSPPYYPANIKIVAQFSDLNTYLVSPKGKPYDSWQGFVKHLKAGEKVVIGATMTHLLGVVQALKQLNLLTDRVTLVNYSGTGKAMNDYIGKHVDMIALTASTAVTMIRKHTAIFNSSDKSSPKILGNVPNAKSLGLTPYNPPRFFAMHPDTPDARVKIMSDRLGRLMEAKSFMRLISKIRMPISFTPRDKAQKAYTDILKLVQNNLWLLGR